MVKSKAWNWEIVEGDLEAYWKAPAIETYYLLNRWQLQDKTTFLDLGCGIGRHTVMFSSYGFKTSAFDLSENAIIKTRAWAESMGLDIDYKIGDMLDLPYEDNSFDCILCMNVISHTDTMGMQKIADKIYDILAPNGECYLTLGSKSSWGYKQDWPVVDANTKIRVEDGPENGIPHFYADYDLIKTIFSKFEVVNVRHIADYIEKYGNVSESYHYHVLIRKK